MNINITNEELLSNFPVQDYEFSGLTYDYNNGSIGIKLKNGGVPYREGYFEFQDVIAFSMQSYSPRGLGNRIYWMECVDSCSTIAGLRDMQKKHAFNTIVLPDEEQYISVDICMNSGNTLLITCKRIIIEDI